MKAYEITDLIEKTAPLELAYDWDNSGFLVGDKNKEVKKILLTLDTNINTVDEAIKNKVDMIISHHPLFFKGIKSIDYSTPQGQLILKLIKNDIAVYAAHTNMDVAKGGINDKLAEALNLCEIEFLEEEGLGRTGKTDKEYTFDEFCRFVSKKLNTPLKVSGNPYKIIKKAAVAGGSCSEVIPTAYKKGCDVIVTSDLKYHETMDSVELGINIIDAGHYPTEICVLEIFYDILKDCDVEIVKSENKDVFNFVY